MSPGRTTPLGIIQGWGGPRSANAFECKVEISKQAIPTPVINQILNFTTIFPSMLPSCTLREESARQMLICQMNPVKYLQKSQQFTDREGGVSFLNRKRFPQGQGFLGGIVSEHHFHD